jgi:hypothetical protein
MLLPTITSLTIKTRTLMYVSIKLYENDLHDSLARIGTYLKLVRHVWLNHPPEHLFFVPTINVILE